MSIITAKTGTVIQFPELSHKHDSRIDEDVSCDCESVKAHDQPIIDDELLDDLQSLSETALQEKYKREYTSYRSRKYRAKQHFSTAFGKFSDFLPHVGKMPGPGKYSLDRINNDDPEYAPGKVRWATPTEQARNRSTTIFLKPLPNLPPEPLPEWAERVGLPADTLRKRRRDGWSHYEIVFGRSGRPRTGSFAWSALVPPKYDWERSYMASRTNYGHPKPESREHWLLSVALHHLRTIRDHLIELEHQRDYLLDRGAKYLPYDLELDEQYDRWSAVADQCRRTVTARGGTFSHAGPRRVLLLPRRS